MARITLRAGISVVARGAVSEVAAVPDSRVGSDDFWRGDLWRGVVWRSGDIDDVAV
jgi:hypothetical protein